MDQPFRPIPLASLAHWIFGALERRDTVLGIPKGNFQIPDPRLASLFQGRPLAAPLGMAAGPHTQLAQNLVAGWLCGARFMELKTVQVLDELDISRPCIDAADETYNCEWSQELRLEQSFDEYLKAWVLIHALAHRLGLPGPGTHFAMSVGYDLAGLRDPRVLAFVEAMRNPGEALGAAVEAVASAYGPIRGIRIPACLSQHLTLSTMHGCPPEEIERIGRFLLEDLGVHTWIKLNPTLLGPGRLRKLLNGDLGYGIQVPDEAFSHDPALPEALAMVRSLEGTAKRVGLDFGLKLTNTLEVENHRGVFPPKETRMYLSGRALHPLTLRLAQVLRAELGPGLSLSFCGGADALNFPGLVAAGLGPVTVCTDLLKPGGYARLQQYLVNLAGALDRAGAPDLGTYASDPDGTLARLAEEVVRDPRYRGRVRPLDFKGHRKLGPFDCIAAPCVEACPAQQNIPDYLWEAAHGRPDGSLAVILRTNPQPGVTGSVCDHPCTDKCVRAFYDAPLAIREIKRFAYEHGEAPNPAAQAPLGLRVAVVGAGPAGLSAAYSLALLGFEVEVFEAREDPGGMVANAIPAYRLDGKALQGDLERVLQLGVKIHYGRGLGPTLRLSELRAAFSYVFLGVGAARGKRLGIPGEEAAGVWDALAFLEGVADRPQGSLGTRVLVIGGGNSAMDAARSARRLTPHGEVGLVYRRTRAHMPADPEEVSACLEEGVHLHELLAPLRVLAENGRVTGLACAPMRLGPRDASGRPRPVPAEGGERVLPADTILSAISQEPVLDFLEDLDPVRNPDGTLRVSGQGETSVAGLFAGGDAVRGPASIIHAIADGTRAAEEMGRRHGRRLPPEPGLDKGQNPVALMERRGEAHRPQVTVPILPLAARAGFQEVHGSYDAAGAAAEASRCLDCDDVCSLCVTVCPNRANIAFATRPLELALPRLVLRGGRLVAEEGGVFRVAQGVQILNLGDACNDCGNCTPFCPTAGEPYRDKPRFWADRSAFEGSPGDAYHLWKERGSLVLEARIQGLGHRLRRGPAGWSYEGPGCRVLLDGESHALLSTEATGSMEEGEAVDLTPLGPMLLFLENPPDLPVEEAAP
ncbi:MAG: FAD-dependent oxidoreductase [Acidobacteria bacterium]|nr:FAD-dependent oxidoreductase [Acidobacteriota bacterium]